MFMKNQTVRLVYKDSTNVAQFGVHEVQFEGNGHLLYVTSGKSPIVSLLSKDWIMTLNTMYVGKARLITFDDLSGPYAGCNGGFPLVIPSNLCPSSLYHVTRNQISMDVVGVSATFYPKGDFLKYHIDSRNLAGDITVVTSSLLTQRTTLTYKGWRSLGGLRFPTTITESGSALFHRGNFLETANLVSATVLQKKLTLNSILPRSVQVRDVRHPGKTYTWNYTKSKGSDFWQMAEMREILAPDPAKPYFQSPAWIVLKGDIFTYGLMAAVVVSTVAFLWLVNRKPKVTHR